MTLYCKKKKNVIKFICNSRNSLASPKFKTMNNVKPKIKGIFTFPAVILRPAAELNDTTKIVYISVEDGLYGERETKYSRHLPTPSSFGESMENKFWVNETKLRKCS